MYLHNINETSVFEFGNSESGECIMIYKMPTRINLMFHE